jgi:hypothetical protein
MAYENFWSQASTTLSITGGADGRLTVGSTYGFFVRQEVVLRSATVSITGVVKEVLSNTVLRVGPYGGQFPGTAQDLSGFVAGSVLFAPMQPIVYRGNGNTPQVVYENEPTKALRTVNVDSAGVHWGAAPASFQYLSAANATITAGNASVTQAFSVGSISASVKILSVVSTMDNAVGISFNGVQAAVLQQNESFGYDLAQNGATINASTTIGVWHTGSVSTTGSVRIQIVS